MQTDIYKYGIIATIFLIYFTLSYKFYVLKLGNLERTLVAKKPLALLNIRHLIGILLFGVLGYLIFPEYANLLSFDLSSSNPYVLIFAVAVMLLVLFLSRHTANKKYKGLDPLVLEHKQHGFSYFGIRVIFLFMYEYFFRGILFFALLSLLPLIWAILCCTALYVLIHIFDSKPEIVGAIPFGIILCLLTFYTQTIWVPFVIHCTLSCVYEVSVYNYLNKKSFKL